MPARNQGAGRNRAEEKETEYPEPYRHGVMPSYGFFVRHVKGMEMTNVEVSYLKEDLRPAFKLEDVKGAEFNLVRPARARRASVAREECSRLHTVPLAPAADTRAAMIERKISSG